MSRIKHGTLGANTPATVDLDDAFNAVEVVITANPAAIYFRVDGVTPTVKGDDCQVVVGTLGAALSVSCPTNTQVIMISTGTPDYCVRGL